MKNYLHFQIKNAFCYSGFIRVLIFMIAFGVVTFLIKCFTVFNSDIIEVPAAYEQFFFNGFNLGMTTIFGIIFPFAACAAFSDSYISDIKSNFLSVCISRGTHKQYFFSKMFAVFICGMLVVFLPQVINYTLCVVTFPLESTNIYSWDLWQADFYIIGMEETFLFKKLYIFSPYLYFMLYVLISSFMSGVVAVIAYQLSFFVRNKIFVISFMFIVMNLSFRYFNLKSIPFDLTEYIFGNYLGLQTYEKMFIVFAFYILLALLPTPLSLKKLRNCL